MHVVTDLLRVCVVCAGESCTVGTTLISLSRSLRIYIYTYITVPGIHNRFVSGGDFCRETLFSSCPPGVPFAVLLGVVPGGTIDTDEPGKTVVL